MKHFKLAFSAFMMAAVTGAWAQSSAFTSETTFVFADRLPPDAPNGSASVIVGPGIVPGVNVIFEISPTSIKVRRAELTEESNSSRAVYSFEMQADRSVVFYEVTPSVTLKALDSQAKASYALAGGAAYEKTLADTFLNKTNALDCFPPGTSASLTLYVSVNKAGKPTLVKGIPEGGLAQCIIDASQGIVLPTPPQSVKSQYTARLMLQITESPVNPSDVAPN